MSNGNHWIDLDYNGGPEEVDWDAGADEQVDAILQQEMEDRMAQQPKGGAMSEAIELFKKDGTTSGAFYCSECRAIFGNEAQAQTCHGERICECGKKTEQHYYMKCRDCQDVEWREKERVKEAERFEKAMKIPANEYNGGMIYSGDKYYDDLEALQDDLFDAPLPEYVWACKDIGVIKASAESIYENMLENMWEDADHHDLNGVDELETAVDVFNKANESISVWEPDYSTALLTVAKASPTAPQPKGAEGDRN